MMAAPGVGIEPLGDLRTKGVLMDVFNEAEEIGITVAQEGLVPSLEEMADGPVSSIEILGVRLAHALHDLGQGNLLRLDQQMNMIVHEDVGVDAAVGAVLVDGKELEVFL